MANQPETPVYDAGVYQLEVADPVQGGVGGVSNAPLLNLARRTAYLKQHMDALETASTGFATTNSPALTGTPTTPTPALGDASQKIPSTDWVLKSIGGILNKSVAGASNVSLTTVEAGNGIFLFTGVITANIAVIVPAASKYWVVANRTTGNFSLTVKTAAGTGVVIPQGLAVVVYCDGTNVFLASSAGQASFTPYLFSPAAGTTSLSITNGYTPGCVMVEKNGALLRTSDYTATNGTTIIIPATVAGDQFTVYAFSSFSIANAVQKSGDVMAGPLSLFAGSTAQTPAQFDSSTSVATMAAVQRELGNRSGFIGIEVNTTLTAANAGMIISNNTSGVVFTLPTAASVRIGTTISIQPRNNCTVSSPSGIVVGVLTGLSSITMGAGESCDFTSNGTTWYATGGSLFVRPIGVGQTWQSLTGSRAVDTSYTNTTGRPIMVVAGVTTTSATGTAIMTIDGVTIGGSSSYNAGSPQASVSAIVPAGSVYRVSTTAGTPTLQSWAELR